jgi:hypothetical protein
MEKIGQKTYKDPELNKIVQEKAAWNKQVSALINDIIHFKKSVNGWPSKYYKQRTRITQPSPIDLPGILGQLASAFQAITNSGNSLLQEQAQFSKSYMKRKTDSALDRLEKTHGPADGPKPTAPTASPNLSQELGKGVASDNGSYHLVSQASNQVQMLAQRFFEKLSSQKYGK